MRTPLCFLPLRPSSPSPRFAQARLSGAAGDRDSLLAQSKAAIAAADKRAAAKAKALAAAQQSEQKLALALETIDAQMAASAAAAAAAAARAAAAAPDRASAEAAVASAREEYDRAEAAVAGRATARQTAEAAVAKLIEEAEAAEQAAADAKLELRALDHRRNRAKKDISAAAEKATTLLTRNPWMGTERSRFGEAGGEYDFSDPKRVSAQQHALADQSASLATLSKRINKKVSRGGGHHTQPRPGASPALQIRRSPAPPLREYVWDHAAARAQGRERPSFSHPEFLPPRLPPSSQV
jgi:structural maintenance of chromosome 2